MSGLTDGNSYHPERNESWTLNVAGPSPLRVPAWAPGPRLGLYYLYFAHHTGSHIRLAYADTPEGPWEVYNPGSGVLSLDWVKEDPTTLMSV